MYAIPISTDCRALYYNKGLLRDAGLVDEAVIGQPMLAGELGVGLGEDVVLLAADQRERLLGAEAAGAPVEDRRPAVIAVQLEARMAESGDLGAEFTRMASYGRVVPDLWMKNATGSPVR